MAPIFAAVFTIVMLSSIGLPGLNGFVGEFLILIGSFLTARWWVVVAATGVILAALYLLWAYQRVFHGEVDDANRSFPELSLREGLILVPLLGLIFFMGIYPKPVLDRIEPSVRTPHRPRGGALGLPRTHRGRRRGGRRVMDVLAQATTFSGPPVDWFAVTPLIILTAGALVLMLAGALVPIRWPRRRFALFTAAVGVAALVVTFVLWPRCKTTARSSCSVGPSSSTGPGCSSRW